MKKIFLTLLAVVCAGVLFTGCSKDNNVTEVNNAYSMFAQITPTEWQVSSDGNVFEYAIDASNVPNGFVFNTDGVLVYVSDKNDENATFSPLPLTTASVDGFNFDYYLQNNTVIVEAIPDNGNKATSSNVPTTNFYFNLVFIQPKDISAANSIKDNYSAVKAAFHLSK